MRAGGFARAGLFRLRSGLPAVAEKGSHAVKKLLVVDDEAGLAQVYARIGAEAGFEARVVSDPLRATGEFLAFRPDVVLLDLIMPEKDGIDVLNEMLLVDPAVRIIVTSGFGNAMLRLAQGLAAFHASDRVSAMKKPVRRADLMERLADIAAKTCQRVEERC